ncbi:hypothetical protein MPH_02136 [Macrophomina phaseolina MS6]|uniref:Uncharacterized protein n=1 Tax=Macrophomina phaseolina (strain MS6) TaxID=1126212 RepID=K2SDY2_MACPH|nr:hypothetical protein MPH_02136 [Macrophomina phaseolina MS6]
MQNSFCHSSWECRFIWMTTPRPQHIMNGICQHPRPRRVKSTMKLYSYLQTICNFSFPQSKCVLRILHFCPSSVVTFVTFICKFSQRSSTSLVQRLRRHFVQLSYHSAVPRFAFSERNKRREEQREMKKEAFEVHYGP